MEKPTIETVTFYMTNVCNLTCTNCATFNNFRFKGHFDWEVTRPYAEKWAEIVDINEIAVMGGEPFLHPDLDTWVYELRKLWPDCPDFRVTSNGTQLMRNVDRIRKYFENRISIEINVHDPALWDKIQADSEEILKDIDWELEDNVGSLPRPNMPDYLERNRVYLDKDGQVLIMMRESYEFFPTSIERIQQGKLFLHRSNPEIAHENCFMKDCHHFVNGLFYKCPTTAMSDLLHRQFSVNDECQEILNRSAHMDPFRPIDEILEFIENLDKPIEQCQLCAEQPFEKMVKVYPLSKTKIRF